MIEQVRLWILSGASEFHIHEAITTTWPGAAVRPLILAALEALSAAGDWDPQLVIGWCVEATRDLYRRMVEIGDFAGALRAVKQLQELAAKG